MEKSNIKKEELSEITDEVNLNDFSVSIPKSFNHSEYSKNGIITIPYKDLSDYVENKQNLEIEIFCDTGKSLDGLTISYRTGSNQITNILKESNNDGNGDNSANRFNIIIIIGGILIFMSIIYLIKK
jgi:hypothetical protein